MVPANVRQFQNRLWAAAKQSPGRRFHALYDRIFRPDVLEEAWRRVRANRGAAGVDGLTLAAVTGGCSMSWPETSVQATTAPRPCGGWRSQSLTALSGRWAFPRSPHRARSSRSGPVSDSVVVTHPFHPLAGERLAVILERRRPSADVVLVCEGGPAGRVTVPVAWTDRGPDRSDYRLATSGLVELAGLVHALHHPPLRVGDGS